MILIMTTIKIMTTTVTEQRSFIIFPVTTEHLGNDNENNINENKNRIK